MKQVTFSGYAGEYPCHGCPDHDSTCHGKCERYLAIVEANAKDSEKRKLKVVVKDYVSERRFKQAKKYKKK